jgi:hypothetical protein
MPSKAISYILHPFLVPLYVMLALFSTGMVPIYVFADVRRWMFFMVAVNAVMVPAAAIIMMRLLGIIKDYSLSTRRDRILPLFVVALCYGLCGWVLGNVPMLFIMQRCMFAAMGCTLFALTVTFFWQISLHMTAVGGAVGIISLLLYAGFAPLVWPLCAAVVLSGLLGSARLYLDKHSPGQVAAGFFGGFSVAVLVLLVTIM